MGCEHGARQPAPCAAGWAPHRAGRPRKRPGHPPAELQSSWADLAGSSSSSKAEATSWAVGAACLPCRQRAPQHSLASHCRRCWAAVARLLLGLAPPAAPGGPCMPPQRCAGRLRPGLPDRRPGAAVRPAGDPQQRVRHGGRAPDCSGQRKEETEARAAQHGPCCACRIQTSAFGLAPARRLGNVDREGGPATQASHAGATCDQPSPPWVAWLAPVQRLRRPCAGSARPPAGHQPRAAPAASAGLRGGHRGQPLRQIVPPGRPAAARAALELPAGCQPAAQAARPADPCAAARQG